MEPSYQTRKIIGRVLAVLCLLGLAGAFWMQLSSPIAQQLAARADTAVRVAILTSPAMRFSYNPTEQKAHITLGVAACDPAKPAACFNGDFDFFYIPQQTVQNTYWTQFKENLATWRYQPLPLFNYVRAYVNARVQKRTNLPTAAFVLLSEELAGLSAADFAVTQLKPLPKKKGKKQPAPDALLSPDEKPTVSLPTDPAAQPPLVLEILNASGKKGLALALTQYLRAQNAKGLLRVDVLQYDNYPTQEETSFIVDYSGKLVQVTQVSHAIGIHSEIRSEKSTTAICDSRIVLGKDFEMPL